MVCVPSRGTPSWVQVSRRRVHSRRCPRSCRLARPSGRRCLTGPSSGRCDFQLRLRSRRIPRSPVPAARRCRPQSRDSRLVLVKAFPWFFTVPWVRARSLWICKTPSCPSRCRVHSPVSSVWLRESFVPVLPVFRSDSLSGPGAFSFSDGTGVFPSRSAGFDSQPLRDGFAATPSFL